MKNFMNVLILKNVIQIFEKVKTESDFLCARNWKFVRTMQYIKSEEKP